ncbi:MAG: MFS transporter [Chloroflexi bacterium]|nr:MFS transporter [Chloroflexota bacterium]
MRFTGRRPHYAWIILGGTMVVLGISSAARFAFGVMIDPLVEEYGWSRGAVSFAYSLQFLIGIPTVLIAGRIAEKTGIRSIAVVGTIVLTIGLLLTATITELWQFHLYYGVLVGGVGASAFVSVLPVVLSRWFHARLGLAMGIMWVSTSLGPAVFMPLLRWSLETIGWSETFVAFGLGSGALMLVASLYLRDRPRDKNLKPYGEEFDHLAPITSASPVSSLNLRQVTMMSSFWGLTAIHLLGCVGHSIPLAHMVSMATFAGLSGVTAAGVLSMAAATSMVSRLGMSLLAEAKGGRVTLFLALLLQTLPTLLLLNARDVASFYSFAVLFGLGYGGEMVGFPIFNRQYYGTEAPLQAIFSWQVAGAMGGMALGGWLGGALFDLTGVYTWSVLAAVAAGLLGMAAVAILPAYKKHPRQS